ncbi:MAG: ELM1/GtrOC1 family putative glycosyltransferase [Methylococcaceae bacterium]|nr:ELM1/GtrOC1 family putative glycosyltransferase [Methylococcaceae bacterium]
MDGKRGHERQTQGLLCALQQQVALQIFDVQQLTLVRAFWFWLIGSFITKQKLPPPAIVLGAGHGTHLTMLAAGRAFSARTIVLMRPSLPLACFDLCIIPEHDGVFAKNVLSSKGALNPVQAATQKDPRLGLILLGGLSRHYEWDDAIIMRQLIELVAHHHEINWLISTSPRTPESTLYLLRDVHLTNVTLFTFHEVDADWLPNKMAIATYVWVTPDSVSMVYEALTAAASVGVFDLAAKPGSKVAHGITDLVSNKYVTTYRDWEKHRVLSPAHIIFNESARCAQWIKQHWFPEH